MLMILLSLGHLATDVSQGSLPALNLFLAEKLRLNYFQIGLVSLFFTLSSALLQPLLGHWSDSRRLTWLLPAGCLASGLGLALTGVVPWYILLLAAVFISGVGVAAYHPVGSKMAHDASGPHRRGLTMSVFSLGGNVGTGLGPVLVYLLVGGGKVSASVFLLGPGLVMAMLFLVVLRPSQAWPAAEGAPSARPVPDARPHPGGLRVPGGESPPLRPVLLLLGYLAARAWLQSGLVYFLPFYLVNGAGRSMAAATFTLSAFLIAGAVGTVLGGLAADRWGGKAGLAGSMGLALAFVFLFLDSHGFLQLAAAVTSGMAVISTHPATVVYAQRLLPGKVGFASGTVLGFGLAMGSVAVTLLGLAADHFGLLTTMRLLLFFPLAGLAAATLLPVTPEERILLAGKRTNKA